MSRYFYRLFICIVFPLSFNFSTFGGETKALFLIPVEEIRLGFMKNDVRGYRGHHHHEQGYNGNIEILFLSLQGTFWNVIYNPKPHGGISVNSHGGTNHVYSGLSWTIQWMNFLIEPSFGGDLNNAKRKKSTRKRQALGYPLLFREAISIGYILSPQWAGYITLDHISNARLTHPNPGITTLGVRMGYRL